MVNIQTFADSLFLVIVALDQRLAGFIIFSLFLGGD